MGTSGTDQEPTTTSMKANMNTPVTIPFIMVNNTDIIINIFYLMTNIKIRFSYVTGFIYEYIHVTKIYLTINT